MIDLKEIQISEEMYAMIGALLGTIIGFTLSELSRFLQQRSKIEQAKKLLREELTTIQSQIPQKLDIIQQMKKGLSLEKFLPGKSVHIITTGYYQNISMIYGHLNPLKRNSLHVIYERLRVGEEFMDEFEDKVRTEAKTSSLAHPLKYHKDRVDEIEESYKVCDDLISKYLKNKPIDVFNINK